VFKLFLWLQAFSLSQMMRSCKSFPRVRKMQTLIYNGTNSVIKLFVCLMVFITFITGGRDRMVVGFTTIYAISAYHHWCLSSNTEHGKVVCLFDGVYHIYHIYHIYHRNMDVTVIVFISTFNNISIISWRSALLVEKTRIPRDFFYLQNEMLCTKHIIVFSLENSFPIVLSGEVYCTIPHQTTIQENSFLLST
jgi:hypothetical protein